MTLDLDSLRCFRAAATHLNFRAAAEAVALSPSAFSARIRALEDEVGASLFERTTRRVRLSVAGERLVPHADLCLEAADRCRTAVRDLPEEPPFSLVLGTRFELGLSWLLPNLDALARRRPARRLHLGFADGRDLLMRLRRGQIDAAVASLRLVDSALAYAALHEERYAFVATAEIAAQVLVDPPRTLAQVTLIDADSSLPLFRYLLDVLPPEPGVQFGAQEWMGTIEAIRRRVLDGHGVAVLPRYYVQPNLDAGELVELMPDVEPRRDYFRLIWLEGHPRGDDLVELAADLREVPLS